ncbi:unnamed protein product [Lepeophtheirus salmonis]|uniref:(salmon louse) hypothetical protein n=1 Tax=Lepeophtheirus salmonis TaxID=72036 RepID=A0A7R8CZT9_LEPSM|nr:myosin-2 heavy chain-like [Lepeophtheirus salmonis]CAB4066871.1 unnamed protein product [Lepeophtheirus salmonis]CAF2978438.1 unnamed protein product [Lepeophtheirus salmonis]
MEGMGMRDLDISSLDSRIQKSIQCKEKKEGILEKLLESQKELRDNMELNLTEIESLYDIKLGRVQSSISTTQNTIETLKGLVEIQMSELEALQRSNTQLEVRGSEFQRILEEKKAEAKFILNQKKQSISLMDEMSPFQTIQAYKLRSYLYSMTNLNWHQKKLKCYSLSSDHNDVKMFSIENTEGALEKEGALIWKHMSYDPQWDNL